MQSLIDYSGAALRWEQPKASKMEYELRSAEALVTTLHFRSSFGSLATAESADGCWTFKRVGFWRPTITVRVCDSPTIWRRSPTTPGAAVARCCCPMDASCWPRRISGRPSTS